MVKPMTQTLEATFDGIALHFDEPLKFEPNTRVRVVVEELPQPDEEPVSFLRLAQTLNLDGPPDWSENVDKYLYGHLHDDK